MQDGEIIRSRLRPRSSRLAVGVAAGIFIASALAGPTAAAPASEVLTLFQGDHTWSASGVFDASGTWQTNRVELGALRSPVAFAGTLFIHLTGANGVIDLRLFVESNQVQEREVCTISGGTGAYAALTGQGTWTEVGGGANAILTCTAAAESP